jgi:hypothetical protein
MIYLLQAIKPVKNLKGSNMNNSTIKNALFAVANAITSNTNSQTFVALQLKSDWSQFLAKPRSKADKLSQPQLTAFNQAFPNGLFKLSNINGSVFGKTSYTTYMQNITGDKDFVAQKPSGRSFVDGKPNITVADKDENQFYLSFNLSSNGLERSKAVFVDSNNNLIAESEVEALSAIFTAKGIPSKIKATKESAKIRLQEKQAKEGQASEDVKPFVHFCPKFETIQFFKCGLIAYGNKIQA